MSQSTKHARRRRRRYRVRAKVRGSAERPRLSVFRSNRGMLAQLIDDGSGHTVASVNWTEGDLRELAPHGPGQAGRRAAGRSARASTAPRPACSTAAATASTGA